jgi:hypothetical protein
LGSSVGGAKEKREMTGFLLRDLTKHTVTKQADYDPARVRALFDEMAATYGIVNLVASFGFAAR